MSTSDVTANTSQVGAAPAGPDPAADKVRITDLLADGARLGKYEILERVGRGGMAIVYRARDTLLERQVAIKQIAAHLADDPRWRERFRKEAQVIARLADHSRHIVNIYELIENAQGVFIVMEFVQGHTLETLLRAERIDLQLALDVLGGVCLGLRAVHAAGAVHRDIKPANIIVPPDRRAKITDFGVAAHQGGDSSLPMGTTRYMAPELFGSGPIDGRSDIYSLGLVAFEMFAGRRNFEKVFANVLGEGRSESLRWMNWHLRMDLALPRLDAINTSIPPALAEIVAQMAAKSLTVRYADINAVIADLKKHFSPGGGAVGTLESPAGGGGTALPAGEGIGLRVGTSTIAAGPGASAGQVFESESPTALVPRRAARRIGRKAWIAAGVGLAACVCFIVMGLLRGPDRLSEMRRLYEQGLAAYRTGNYAEALAPLRAAIAIPAEGHQAEQGRRFAQQAAALAEFQISLAAADFAAARVKLEEAARLGLSREAQTQHQDALVRAQARHEAQRRFEQMLTDGELEAARRLQRETAEQSLIDPSESAEWTRRIEQAQGESSYYQVFRAARQALERGDFEQALKHAQQAKAQQSTDAVEKLIAEIGQVRDFNEATGRGDEALAVGDFAAAARHFDEARRLKPSPEADARFRAARAREQLAAAQAAVRAGRWAEARDLYAAVLKQGENDEARRELDRVTRMLALREALDKGQRLADAGDWEQALAVWLQARPAEVAELDEELKAHVAAAQCQVALRRGDALAAQKKWEEARAAYEEAARFGAAQEAQERIRKMDVDRLIRSLLPRGDAARDAGQYSEALKIYQEARKHRENDPEIQARIDDVKYRQHKAAGEANLRAGNYRAAIAELRQAARLRPDDADVARMLAEAERKLEAEG